MPRDPIPTWFYVKIVVRQGDRFLLVQEQQYENHWHLPAGRVERNETFVAAALRETVEETGVPVKLEGVLRVEHTPHADSTYMGVIFLARPAAEVPPKSVPDTESLCARWFTVEEAQRLSLREVSILEVLRYVRSGGTAQPLSVLAGKRDPYVVPTGRRH